MAFRGFHGFFVFVFTVSLLWPVYSVKPKSKNRRYLSYSEIAFNLIYGECYRLTSARRAW